jgi:uncharacterized damage-inducible protein DinB
MVNNDCIRTMIAYHHALYDRLWDSIMHLTDEQFRQTVDYSHGSIRNHMVHVATVDARWLYGLEGRPEARRFHLDPTNYPTRQETRTLWDSTAQDMMEYVASLDDTALEKQPPGMGGPVWQVLLHVVNHGTDHRAQVLRILHDFGAPTFDQDLIFHVWSR